MRHILVTNKALADKLYSQLQSSDKNFATLAKKYSTDTVSAKNGGDLGVIPKGQTVPTFAGGGLQASPRTWSPSRSRRPTATT